MISVLRLILEKLQKKKKHRDFIKKWTLQNTHNNVTPKNSFDMKRVKIGSYSYGALELFTYNSNNTNDILEIGNFVSISSNVKFFLDEHHQSKTFTTFPLKSIFFGMQNFDDAISKGSIIIDDEVWIGANSTILSGVHIGKGAIVATGSVVVSNIPPYSVVGGVPAKIIKFRFDQELIDKLTIIKLINIPKTIIESNIEIFYKEINLEVIQTIEGLIQENENKNESIRK